MIFVHYNYNALSARFPQYCSQISGSPPDRVNIAVGY